MTGGDVGGVGHRFPDAFVTPVLVALVRGFGGSEAPFSPPVGRLPAPPIMEETMLRQFLLIALVVLFAVPSCATLDNERAGDGPTATGNAASHAAAATELLEVTRSREMMERSQAQTLSMIMESMESAGIRAENRERFERCFRLAKEFIDREMSWERVEPEFVQAYTNVYDEADLRQLIDFYRSPVGRKMIERQPLLEAEALRIMRNLMADSQPRLMALLRDEIASGAAGGPETADWAAGDSAPDVARPPLSR
ncbi:DUF2059 domain-containing protein [Lentisalinibacter sediminis]|uniref:DUF2059 domain-containing protein n=1 Tax=Lentisalinibacter sediminis TaxID=2992237 RepID=UPI003865C9D5